MRYKREWILTYSPSKLIPRGEYKLELYLDFTHKSEFPNAKYIEEMNKNIDSLFENVNKVSAYTKTAYANNEQKKELLKRIKSQNEKVIFLKYVNAAFDDNYPDDWIVYEYKDVEHAAFKKPSVLQLQIEQLKSNIIAELKRAGF